MDQIRIVRRDTGRRPAPGQVIRWKSWHRWTAVCLLACLYFAVTVALQR